MVIERVELEIKPGEEGAFEQAVADEAKGLLAGAEGCSEVVLARGVESPSKYLLMLHWGAVEEHVAFTETAEFGRFRELVGPYFAGAPSMEHFAPV